MSQPENAVVQTLAPSRRVSLVEKFAARFSIEPEKLLSTLKATAFRQRDANVQITNEQMAALLVVADQYGLNPFTKEIFAFEDKGAIVPVVSVDGWGRIINSNEQFNGVEFRYSETVTTPQGGKACPEWCEVVIYRKDRDRPTVVREYLDEVYRAPFKGRSKYKEGETYDIAGPWQSHTKRMLRHKTLIQGARLAFGFAGIYDEDEAHRVIEAHAVDVTPQPAALAAPRDASEKVAVVKDRLKAAAAASAAPVAAPEAPAPSGGPENGSGEISAEELAAMREADRKLVEDDEIPY
jgi:phage recombination protein Bet